MGIVNGASNNPTYVTKFHITTSRKCWLTCKKLNSQ